MVSEIQIIIADDHPIVRQGLRQVIERESDLKVLAEADDGLVALEQIAKFQPDVAVLDLDMPRMDGIEATRRIKAKIPNARILILTSFNDDFMRASALAAGAVGFMLKDDLSHVAEFLREFHSMQSM